MIDQSLFFFFNDTATTEIYTLSLHDALPISGPYRVVRRGREGGGGDGLRRAAAHQAGLGALARRQSEGVEDDRSEEHTSELQSRQYLVCRLLLEKKKTNDNRERYMTYRIRPV